MRIDKQKYKNITSILIGVLFFIGTAMPIKAELPLTQEEKNYIANENVIKVVSSEGTAPFQYTNKKGEVKGISHRILEEISDMTGLIFEYELYDSLEEMFASEYDLIAGISPSYTNNNLLLSPPYIKTETILYINSSVDPNELESKVYAAIEGGSLPQGIKEQNARYYKTREESLDAVDDGEADYGYGNAYSVAFYTLQNGYRNIVTIPKGKESREYSIGVPKENIVLASIINKSLEAIDERHMQTLILDETSHVDRKVTYSMVVHAYGKEIFGIIALVIAILLFSVIANIRAKNKLGLQNKRYELLAHISNEYLYEYYVKDDYLALSEKCSELFGSKEKLSEIKSLLKQALFNKVIEKNTEEIKLPLANGKIGVFKAVSSSICDDKGNVYSIIGKLIDISEEVAKKEELMIKAQVDGLTGLYNTMTTKELIDVNIKNSNRDKINALIVMDCDKFKDINDTFGHLIGDEVLKELSTALKLTFEESDIIGRIGGDEFCIYMKDIQSVDIARLKCKQVNTLIQRTNQEFHISVSAGIAILKEEQRYEELFKKADDALYEAKSIPMGSVVYDGHNIAQEIAQIPF